MIRGDNLPIYFITKAAKTSNKKDGRYKYMGSDLFFFRERY